MSFQPSPYPDDMYMAVQEETTVTGGGAGGVAQSFWVLEEDGVSKWVLEEGTGFWITEESS